MVDPSSPVFRRQLFETGRAIGAKPDSWLPEPPRLEALERVSEPVVAKARP